MRQIKEYFNMAINNISLNKGRSVLTILGIVIGISSVITITTIGDGLKYKIISSKDSKAKIYVYTGNRAIANNDYITDSDIEMMLDTKGVENASPDLNETGLVKTSMEEYEATITAGTTVLKEVYLNDAYIKYGRFYSDADIDAGNLVCVITRNDAKKIFGSENAIGLEIPVTISGATKSLEVIGVLEDKEEKDNEKDNEEENVEGFEFANVLQIYMPHTLFKNCKNCKSRKIKHL